MVANPAPAKEGDGGEQKTGPVSDDDHVLLTLQLTRRYRSFLQWSTRTVTCSECWATANKSPRYSWRVAKKFVGGSVRVLQRRNRSGRPLRTHMQSQVSALSVRENLQVPCS